MIDLQGSTSNTGSEHFITNIKRRGSLDWAGAAAAALAVPGSGGGGSGGGLRGSSSEDPSETSTTEARLKDGFAASLQTEARCNTQRAKKTRQTSKRRGWKTAENVRATMLSAERAAWGSAGVGAARAANS